MRPLPVEIWHQVFSHLEHQRKSLSALCRVSKEFNAIGQLLLFRDLSPFDLRNEDLLDVLLISEQGPYLGDLVRTAGVLVQVKLEGLSGELEWQQDEELRTAYEQMEKNTDRAFSLLVACPNIQQLRLIFDYENTTEDHHPEENSDFVRPVFRAGRISMLPCFSTLQALSLSDRSASFFKLDGLVDLLPRLKHLQSLDLVNFAPLSLMPLSTHLRYTASNLKNLCWRPGSKFSPADVLEELAKLPSVTNFTLDCLAMFGNRDLIWNALQTRAVNARTISSVTSFRLLLFNLAKMDDLSVIARNFPALHYLHLSLTHLSYATFNGILIDTESPFGRLQVLSLCFRVNSMKRPDTVAGVFRVVRDFTKLVDPANFPYLRRYRVMLAFQERVDSTIEKALYDVAVESAGNLPTNVEAEIVFQLGRGKWSQASRRQLDRQARCD